jgi:hypothetical protein
MEIDVRLCERHPRNLCFVQKADDTVGFGAHFILTFCVALPVMEKVDDAKVLLQFDARSIEQEVSSVDKSHGASQRIFLSRRLHFDVGYGDLALALSCCTTQIGDAGR